MNFIEEKIEKKGNFDKLKFRFSPEPNFSIHVGHAKSICLNFGLSEKYGSECILRFDDTNPVTSKDDHVKSIINDVHWLGYTPSKITYTSDYFSEIFNCAIHLIERGLAYVDDSTSEEIASMKGTPTLSGSNSPYRNRTIEENLFIFNMMKSGSFPEGSRTLRAKIDMSSPNMILRDPILYRISNTPHPRTGNNWKIYPMYDFAHPLCDYFENISDSLCTLEFEIHKPLYMWVLENSISERNVNIPLPEETEFARLNLDYNIMSKRKFKELLENNIIDGYDDPRIPTISGMKRRGYTPESIKNFCEKIGITKRESLISQLILEETLRDDLNKKAKRLMGVMNPIKLTIINWDINEEEMVEIENNPEDESFGKRKIAFGGDLFIEREDFMKEANIRFHRLKLGGEVRLKGAYVVKAIDCIEDEDGNVIEVLCEYDPLTRSGISVDRKIKGTIHWVNRNHGIKKTVRNYDILFNHPDPSGGGKNFLDHINGKSIVINENAIIEPSIEEIDVFEPIQMMRMGYYVLDKDGCLNRSVGLKSGF